MEDKRPSTIDPWYNIVGDRVIEVLILIVPKRESALHRKMHFDLVGHLVVYVRPYGR